MVSDRVWSALFACATAVLMLGILLLRTATPPAWALMIFPTIGASLAHVASRTTNNRRQIMWLETSTIAAACVVVLMLMVNGFLIDLFVRAVSGTAAAIHNPADLILFFVLAGGSVLLWWAFERRVKRLRDTPAGTQVAAESDRGSA